MRVLICLAVLYTATAISFNNNPLKLVPTKKIESLPVFDSGLDSESNDIDSVLTMSGGAAVQAGLPSQMKLIIGAGGIYAAFLYYGSLQEDVFSYVSDSGTSFKQAWFLQCLEAAANVIVGYLGLMISGGITPNMPKKMFAVSGVTQVSAKAFTSLALANGLSFPVATLAKSGKMVPVMIGSLLLGGAKYR